MVNWGEWKKTSARVVVQAGNEEEEQILKAFRIKARREHGSIKWLVMSWIVAYLAKEKT